MRFGYYQPNLFIGRMNKSLALRDFQITFGLNPTGLYDKPTSTLMDTPRCGRPDNEIEGNGFAYYSPKWKKKFLTYYFSSYTDDISQQDLFEATAKAFKYWSDVSGLQFKQVVMNGDIVIG